MHSGIVRLVSGLLLSAAIFAIAAPLSVLILVRAGALPRRTRLAIGAALPVAALGLAGAAADGLLAQTVDQTRLAGEAAIAVSLAIALATAGVLVLPAVPGSGRARLRHVLDGLVAAASLFYIAWSLVLEPVHRRLTGGPVPLKLTAPCLVVAGPCLVALVALGIVTAVAIDAPRARRACVVAAVGGVAGATLPAAIFFGRPFEAVAAALGCTGALLWLAPAARAAAPHPPVSRDRPHGGLAMSLVLVGLAVAASGIRLIFLGGWIDRISVASAAVVGLALATQQALARIELRRTTDRLIQSEAHFRSMAYTDPLTGLANRRQLLVTLRDDAVGGPPCVLLAIDLDGFKNVNDIRGHDVGDAVLIELARRLRTNVRPGDLAVRVGGDEFAVLMWARAAEATAVAERVLAVLGKPYEVDGGSVFVSASIGLATCSTADTIEQLMRNADVALRFAKQRGKHRVEQYDLAYDQWLRRRTDLEHELRGAVERGELMLAYQPITHLPDGRVVGVEALLRWHHPRLGTVSPDEFIPLAEEAGLINGLGAFVLHEACHQLSRWLADGHDVYLAINVSVRELHTPEYAVQVADVLRAHRLPPERVVIEVTEHAVAIEVQQLVDRLTALREGGVRIALDDFGSGYSSLGQLRTLPVDILKIDRALIAPPGAEPVRFVPPLADVVVQLGNRLGLDVVAEGITDEGQRRVLEEAGCRYAQGDLFGRPMPAERVEALFGAGPVPAQRAAEPEPAQNVGSVDSAHEMRQS